VPHATPRMASSGEPLAAAPWPAGRRRRRAPATLVLALCLHLRLAVTCTAWLHPARAPAGRPGREAPGLGLGLGLGGQRWGPEHASFPLRSVPVDAGQGRVWAQGKQSLQRGEARGGLLRSLRLDKAVAWVNYLLRLIFNMGDMFGSFSSPPPPLSRDGPGGRGGRGEQAGKPRGEGAAGTAAPRWVAPPHTVPRSQVGCCL
jgi:hypothetical protein